MVYPDLTGQKFGLVTAVERGPPTSGAVYYKTQCECGVFKWLRGANMRQHPPKSHETCFYGWLEEKDSAGKIVISHASGARRNSQPQTREQRWKDAEQQIFRALREDGCSEAEARSKASEAIATRRRKAGTSDAVHGQDNGADAQGLASGPQREGQQGRYGTGRILA